jgi:hypothetical protein
MLTTAGLRYFESDILGHHFFEPGLFGFNPVSAERQCPEFEESLLVRPLLPSLICRLVYQRHVNVDDDGSGRVLHGPANHARRGLRERKRCPCKK